MTRNYSVFLVKTVSPIRTRVYKMAICVALKTDHICIHALRQKTLTWSDLEGCVLLRGSKLVFGWEKPSVLPTLAETWF